MTDDRTYAQAARAWPFEEARKLVDRYKAGAPKKGYVLFETGYGPSGLPHIGTFGEVVRCTMVRQAGSVACCTCSKAVRTRASPNGSRAFSMKT